MCYSIFRKSKEQAVKVLNPTWIF